MHAWSRRSSPATANNTIKPAVKGRMHACMSGLGVVGDGCLWPASPFVTWMPVPSAPLQLASASTFAGFELASLPTFPWPAGPTLYSLERSPVAATGELGDR